MKKTNSAVHNISDTSRWVACFRACETERHDALFRDPYAKRLAGERGFEIAKTLRDGNKHEWAWNARTYLFDQFLLRSIRQGADLVLNLGAGLDARPYRMELPQELRWIEVDLPEIIAYKQEILAEEKPKCILERVAADLMDRSARRVVFNEADDCGTRVLVVTEGLLLYFANDEVAALAEDLAAHRRFRSWITDMASPGQLRLMQRTTGKQLGEVGVPFKFGPTEGPDFFKRYGWELEKVDGIVKTAARLNRLPVELYALLPEPRIISGNYPWTGVCVLKRS